MAKADRKRFGPGMQGKGDGTGAMTDLDDEKVRKNDILSNRDKAQHIETRGLDSRNVQNEQLKDHSANRRREDPEEAE